MTYFAGEVRADSRVAWTRFREHSVETPILQRWGTTPENKEFDNYEDTPIWKDNINACYRFALTMKFIGCFDGTGGQTFRKRAKRKSNSILVRYFKTKNEMEGHPLMNGYFDPSYYVFCWERDNAEYDFENGVF